MGPVTFTAFNRADAPGRQEALWTGHSLELSMWDNPAGPGTLLLARWESRPREKPPDLGDPPARSWGRQRRDYAASLVNGSAVLQSENLQPQEARVQTLRAGKATAFEAAEAEGGSP